MGLNDIAVKVGKLEERMNALEERILEELAERKEGQLAINDSIKAVNNDVRDLLKKMWWASGALAVLITVLKFALK